jgi:hypothetical protein
MVHGTIQVFGFLVHGTFGFGRRKSKEKMVISEMTILKLRLILSYPVQFEGGVAACVSFLWLAPSRTRKY